MKLDYRDVIVTVGAEGVMTLGFVSERVPLVSKAISTTVGLLASTVMEAVFVLVREGAGIV